MSDLAAVLVALAAAGGALAARPLPLALALAVVAVALAVRRPLMLAAGVALAASALAARSWAGLHPPAPRPVSSTVTLVTDPSDVAGALRVDVRLGGRRVEAWARGHGARRLRTALAGERVRLIGHLGPVPVDDRRRLAPRHVAGRLTVDRVEAWSAGGWASQLANRMRRTLVSGAEHLPPERRSLLAGFVLGDDRGQPPEVTFDFRASGLSHLLVVSGQNVAFVLTVAGPLLRRLSVKSRVGAGVVILVLFGTLTRWEPSVLRAVAMAGIALLAVALGRPASTLRVLSLAVAGLLLVDPLLVHSIGFGLSVGACAGIALWSRPLARAMPGPRPVAEALGVTLAAQAGVAPLLVPIFGGIPVVALLANLLALPAAGPLMVWGLAAGLPAGLVGGVVARAVHVPTQLLLAWVAGVARVAAGLPFGQLHLTHLAGLVACGIVGVWALRRQRFRLVRGAVVASACIFLAPAVQVIRPTPATGVAVARGASLWRAGQASILVLVGARSAPDRLLSGLHTAGVRHLDLLVASRPGVTEARAAATVLRRFPARLVLAPPEGVDRLSRAQAPPAGTEVRVGRLVAHFEHIDGRLAVTVTATATATAASGRSRDPPRIASGRHAVDPRRPDLRPGHPRPGGGGGEGGGGR